MSALVDSRYGQHHLVKSKILRVYLYVHALKMETKEPKISIYQEEIVISTK